MTTIPTTLPERDPSKPAEAQGLFRKFDVHRVDGSDASGGKHHGCEYFVLDTTHDQHAAAALVAYAHACKDTHPQLSADLMARHAPQQAVAASSEPVPDQEEDAYVINRLASILADVAIALKGEELSLHRHSYHDLPDVARALKLEVELHRMQEAERQASTNQPVQAKALTDEQIKDAILRLDDCEVIDGNGVTQEAIAIVRALLVSQPSAQADVAAVRDVPINVEFAAAYLDGVMEAEHPEIQGKWKTVRTFLKSAAPTAQPQADGVKP